MAGDDDLVDADQLDSGAARELARQKDVRAEAVLPAADIAARAGMLTAEYNPHRDLAETRRAISAWLIIILAFTILLVAVLPLLYLLGKGTGDFEQVKDILLVVFSPLVTLVTAVTAFYFGEKSGGSGSG